MRTLLLATMVGLVLSSGCVDSSSGIWGDDGPSPSFDPFRSGSGDSDGITYDLYWLQTPNPSIFNRTTGFDFQTELQGRLVHGDAQSLFHLDELQAHHNATYPDTNRSIQRFLTAADTESFLIIYARGGSSCRTVTNSVNMADETVTLDLRSICSSGPSAAVVTYDLLVYKFPSSEQIEDATVHHNNQTWTTS